MEFTKEQTHVEIVRDLFLLQCYTGLRFGDASRLSREHIFETTDGLEIRMISEKENKVVNLPLRYLFKDKTQDTATTKDSNDLPGEITIKESRPERLLRKYWRDDNTPFFLSLKHQQDSSANNQYVNRVLKDIQTMAGVQTTLTNHVGRHTFATFLVWLVPLPVVQELLQHSKVETTMIYIHVGTDKVKEQLRKITDWL